MTESEPISATEFASRLHRDLEDDKHFAIFLGPGCSRFWELDELTKRLMQEIIGVNGTRSPHYYVPGYEEQNAGAFYGEVLQERFGNQWRERQHDECRNILPTVGHAILALLLADRRYKPKFSAILTTNFDNLIAEAFYRYTVYRPFLVDRAALASFISYHEPSAPIIKLHGDRPAERNKRSETYKIPTNMQQVVRRLLRGHGIIFIGYPGDDEGIAQMFGHSDFKHTQPIYWIHGTAPGSRLVSVLPKHEFTWVNHHDFDSLMLLLQEELQLEHSVLDIHRETLRCYSKSFLGAAENLSSAHGESPFDAWDDYKNALQRSGFLHVIHGVAQGSDDLAQIWGALQQTDDDAQLRLLMRELQQKKNCRMAQAFAQRASSVGKPDTHIRTIYDKSLAILEPVADPAEWADLATSYAEFLKGGEEKDVAIYWCQAALRAAPNHSGAQSRLAELQNAQNHTAASQRASENFLAEMNMKKIIPNWIPNASDDVVLSMHPNAIGAWRRGALPNASELHLRELIVTTPPANWHITESPTSSHWTDVERKIRAQLTELEQIACSRIHVFANGPYALAAFLGHQLEERFGRGGRALVFYQFNPGSRIWEDWGPNHRLPFKERERDFFAYATDPTPTDNVKHVVVALHISRELSKEEMGRALAEQGAEQPLVWIDARPADGVSQQALDGSGSVDKCFHEIDALVSKTAEKYPNAKIHLFYSGPLAILMRAVARFHLLQTDATLYERIASGGGYVLVPALDFRGAPRLRMGAASVGNVPRSPALSQPVHIEPLPSKLQVLTVATEWASRKGGLSTLNRHLCIALARAGHDVTCLVPAATNDEYETAAKANVRLIAAPEPTVPEMARLFLRPDLNGVRAPHVLIGHGRVTGDAARIQARNHFPGSLLVHFVHTTPNHIEWFKGDGISADTSRKADERTRFECALAAAADLVVGVGPRLTGWITDEVVTGMQREVPILRLDPGLTDISPVTLPPRNVHCLLLGRAEDRKLKGLDLALCALQAWPEQPPALVIRGVPGGSAAEFADWVRSVAPRVDVRSFDYVEDEETIAGDIRKASVVLMPSREEGFGLVGLEAISAAVPVLVSDMSGLGEVLLEHGTESAKRAIVHTSRADDDANTTMWRRAIDRVLHNRNAAYEDAKRLRTELATVLDWNVAAEKLISEVRKLRQIAQCG